MESTLWSLVKCEYWPHEQMLHTQGMPTASAFSLFKFTKRSTILTCHVDHLPVRPGLVILFQTACKHVSVRTVWTVETLEHVKVRILLEICIDTEEFSSSSPPDTYSVHLAGSSVNHFTNTLNKAECLFDSWIILVARGNIKIVF